ncbi:MAG TPA: glycosyltransferase family 39 protein [Pyrinomonadaceae bacterium]|nr:glycosyltransferase family 39 protein [Pyrinomonadaceae bacterium]
MIQSVAHPRRLILALIAIVLLGFVVRVLTAHFIATHLNDPGWFQSGSFAIFDRQAQNALDGKESFFWISDSSRTDLIEYPPGNKFWIGFIYAVTGERSALSVQRFQLFADSLSILLIIGIGISAFSWNTGLIAGLLAALSPMLALYGVTPGADAVTSWFVLASVWALIVCCKRKSVGYAILAGVLLGLACWLRVNPLFLFGAWFLGLLLFLKAPLKKRLQLAAVASLASILIIAPVVVRNLIVFYPQVAPTGLGIGWNFLAGIGETERGAEFGAPCCDQLIIEQERAALGLPPDAPLGLVYPDGITRDRQRGQRAIAIIKAHPIWYAGVMARRIAGHLKLAGKPVPSMGSTGINVTSQKSLPSNLQRFPFSSAVNALGMVQSVLRYLALPLILVGIWFGFRQSIEMSGVLTATVVYYLATLSVAHSEVRYALPMHGIFCVFAAVAVFRVIPKRPTTDF